MKLKTVLLRWYKSFNIRYRFEMPPRLDAVARPWDALDVGKNLANDYPFIEIPIEDDITTIVGGNESGKSHLISAISKVLKGTGVKDERFAQTDLCRYATVPTQDPNRWPNIGLHISVDPQLESSRIKEVLPNAGVPADAISELTIILGSPKPDVAARVFVNRGPVPLSLSEDQLTALRLQLPHVRFLDAEAALPDNLTLAELLAACDPTGKTVPSRFATSSAQSAAEFIATLNVAADEKLTPAQLASFENMKSALLVNRIDLTKDALLAAKLFLEILAVGLPELKQVLDQPVEQRGYTEYFLKQWNDRVFERLDLAHFWQQDDQASIELIYKDRTLYFDITDKTGATYTFKERSSGLRYFLSYYIQAKALELHGRERNSVILMDEPDSFLSILGQRNLLTVFESLVGRERSAGKAQLLYTTHSPFLINRNFPRRIRVVVKEEAEEGTQYYGRASARRFEPVRSALEVDSAQTLFMGATNLVLEGLTDQYLISETVRALVTPDTEHQFIDLNSIVVVSADGVTNIEKVLSSSRTGSEPIPATVVLVDGDKAGRDAIDDIIGKTTGKERLIEAKYCLILASDLHESMKGLTIETIEDLVPRSFYLGAFLKYLHKWQPEVIRTCGQSVTNSTKSFLSKMEIGNVHAVKGICKAHNLTEDYDKLGVLEIVLEAIAGTWTFAPPDLATQEDVQVLIQRMKQLFGSLNVKINESKQDAARSSMSATVKRLIKEFVRVRENGCSVIELRRHLGRLGRETKELHGIGEKLASTIEFLVRQVEKVEQANQGNLVNEDWTRWKRALERIKRDPLSPLKVEEEIAGTAIAEDADEDKPTDEN